MRSVLKTGILPSHNNVSVSEFVRFAFDGEGTGIQLICPACDGEVGGDGEAVLGDLGEEGGDCDGEECSGDVDADDAGVRGEDGGDSDEGDAVGELTLRHGERGERHPSNKSVPASLIFSISGNFPSPCLCLGSVVFVVMGSQPGIRF